jgi:uncharacterized membrane protein YeaQ/YmgE (transglycosylase-associated protein family)
VKSEFSVVTIPCCSNPSSWIKSPFEANEFFADEHKPTVTQWEYYPGSCAGALAKFIMPGRDPGGFIVTTLIGIAGAIVGGFLGTFIGLGKIESFDLGGIFIATAGAFVLLIAYRIIRK